VPTRVAYLSPLPPMGSGISDYSDRLLDELSSRLDVVAYGGAEMPPRWSASMPVGLQWRPQQAWAADADSQPFDAAVYHVGNAAVFHDWIVTGMHLRPSVVVLHDMSLVDLWYGLGRVLGGDGEFIERFRNEYGRIRTKEIVEPGTSDALNYHWLASLDRLRWPMVRSLVDTADCVVVHSQWAKSMIHRSNPSANVVVAPFGAMFFDRVDADVARAEFGFSADDAVIGVLGGISRPKQIHTVVEAYLAVRSSNRHARLLIAGRADDDAYLQAIRDRLRRAGAEDDVVMILDCPTERMAFAHAAADIVVNLRRPTVGETSASLLYSFGAGRPAVVSAHPQMVEYPGEFCFPISVEPIAEQAELTALLERLLLDREQLVQAGLAARRWATANSSWSHTADAYVEAIDVACRSHHAVPSAQSSSLAGEPIHVIGDMRAGSGLAEAGRRLVQAVTRTGAVPLLRSIEISSMPRAVNPAIPYTVLDSREPFREEIGRFALSTLNLNEFSLVPRDLEKLYRDESYLIAYWFWEGARVPSVFRNQVNRVDEIWVATTFVKRAFEAENGPPVCVIPTPIELQVDHSFTRANYGLPEDKFIFLFTFDASSSEFRKNPFGVVDAYARAFPERVRERPMLVLKINNLKRNVAFADEIRRRALAHGVVIFEEDLSPAAMSGLLNNVDCYVSLHRCEGFGLGMAEAMFLGKPVIATGFSANLDFTRSDNSYLVGYDMRPVSPADFSYNPGAADVYGEGLVWAEPDIDQAAFWMRHVAENPELATAVGAKGSVTIRSEFSVDAVAQRIQARLSEISPQRRSALLLRR